MDIHFPFPDGQREAREVNGLVPGKSVRGDTRVCAQVFWLHVHGSFHNVLLGFSAPDGVKGKEGHRKDQLMFPAAADQEAHRMAGSGLLASSGGLKGGRESAAYLEGFVSLGAGATWVHHLLPTYRETSFQ